MKAGAILLALLFLAGSGERADFRVALSYHSKLVRNREWRISVYRTGRKIYLDVDGYRNRRLVSPLDRGEYMKLVDFLNGRGVWRLKGNYPEQSPNAYHLIEVESGKYRNSFKVEAGPLLSGRASEYREIIRRLENLARMKLDG